MSDKLDDIDKLYRQDVLSDHVSRNIALFTIPEYPELDSGSGEGMWSACLDALLTALRYLAPATLLTLLWGQQSFLFRILKHIDLAIRAVVFSSDEQKQSVLKWLAEAGPVRVEHLDTVWRHGWILCGVLDTALPGACAGHPPTRQTLKHAQTIADHYLGVDPVFSRQELEANDCLSKGQEWKLAHYLDRIRSALAKIPPPVSKPTSQRTSPEAMQFTLDYIARGSGLTAAQINYKMHFKVYPTTQQSLEPGEITVLIRGSKDTYGMVVIPPILGKAQTIRQKLLNLQAKRQYTENVLPITQGATYLRTFGRNDMNKTYHIPKTKYDIETEVEVQNECAKVSYLVNLEGKYEISIVSRGQSIVGSPFTVTASNNIIGTLEKESCCLEDGEEIDIVDVKTERKVVLRIVDFVTEKMLLRENGTLEKISSDEANILMTTDNIENKGAKSIISSQEYDNLELFKDEISIKTGRFRQVATKVKSLLSVCKIFYEAIRIKASQDVKIINEEVYLRPQSRIGIPDVVNSTFNDSIMHQYTNNEKFERVFKHEYLTPLAPKCKENDCEENTATNINESIELDNTRNRFHNTGLDTDVTNTTNGANNPFLNDIDGVSYTSKEKYADEFEDPAFIAEIERLDEIPIKIVIQEDDDESVSPTTNPFIEPELIERPKTPVLKIITGEVKDRADSVYVDAHIEQITEQILSNEFVNPFFIHQRQTSLELEKQEPVTTFIIGAPVSLPPTVTAPSPDPDMSSIMITSNDQSFSPYDITKSGGTPSSISEDSSSPVFSTPLHAKLCQNSITSSTFHSLDSNLQESTEDFTFSKSKNNNEFEISMVKCNTSIESSKKDTWDSAYVSIDENNSSPDSNNNDNILLSETPCKVKYSPNEDTILKPEDFVKMGPAEKELWKSCTELTFTAPNMTEELISSRWERRPLFTPIIEESDRSMSGNLRESGRSTKQSESDPVTVAFAELNDIFQEYNSTSEQSSLTTSGDYILDHSNELEYTIETDDTRVESASEPITDVIRPTTILEEGEISEVQPNVTESVSVSQTLPSNQYQIESSEFNYGNYRNQIKFGENKETNIVFEKKKYWDQRIREIEETRSEQAKKAKRLISKNLRHNDSLTKRRGKQIVKNILNSDQTDIGSPTKYLETPVKYGPEVHQKDKEHADVKLVEKWKKYWDEKLESEQDESHIGCFRVMPNKSKHEQSLSPQSNVNSDDDINFSSPNLESYSPSDDDTIIAGTESNMKQVSSFTEDFPNKSKVKSFNNIESTTNCFKQKSSTLKDNLGKSYSSTLPTKQELPEEVFKAFETSPKRFFGTSRKQILNKIDAFLGKPSTADEVITSSEDISGASHEKGLVSSRVSMFHNISHVEDVPWKSGKSSSMLNLRQRKNSDKERDVSKQIEMLPENLEINKQTNTVQNKIKAYSKEINNLSLQNQWNRDKSASMLNIRHRKDSEQDNEVFKSLNNSPETVEPHYYQGNTIQNTKSISMQNIGEHENSDRVNWSSISPEIINENDKHDTVQNKNNFYSSEAFSSPTGLENFALRNKRLRLTSLDCSKHFDKLIVIEKNMLLNPTLGPETNVQKTVKDMNRLNATTPSVQSLRKSTISKSEMDIFSKISNIKDDDDLEKHKSYEVLPKANVKNFINMYETATKTAKLEPKPLIRKLSRTSSVGSEKLSQIISSITGTSAARINQENDFTRRAEEPLVTNGDNNESIPEMPKPPPRKKRGTSKSSQENLNIGNSVESLTDFKANKYHEFQNNNARQERYISLSDIEVEIIDQTLETVIEPTQEKGSVKEHKEEKYTNDPIDYKSRFKLAKQYFQSLDELRVEDKKIVKLNECEQLLLNESPENNSRPQRVKKNIKSRSMDSSELAKVWSQMQEASSENDNKLVKISEKFNVDDLFTDVTEGKLSRQGSLRGIPHKKAVLEAFRSMENISDTKLSSYEITITQLTDFAKENKIKNAQTYLTEYPYLPTTVPSKYHSRLDAKASGLVSMKELLDTKPRRNSVPDIRMNPKFTVDV